MAKDPAFLFYPSDFLTGTMFMTNEQIGIYIRLLCSQHQHGGIIDKDSFNALVGTNLLIKNKFIETETGFYNERLTIEMDKRNKKSNNMSDTAKEVWKKRKEQMQYKSKKNEYNSNTNVLKNDTNVIQTVNRNEDININKDISIIEQYFIDFENGSHIVEMARFNKTTVEVLKNFIPHFKLKVNAEYPSYGKFIDHFRNTWLLNKDKINLNKPKGGRVLED